MGMTKDENWQLKILKVYVEIIRHGPSWGAIYCVFQDSVLLWDYKHKIYKIIKGNKSKYCDWLPHDLK